MVSSYGNARKDPWGEKRIQSTQIDHPVVGAFLLDQSGAHLVWTGPSDLWYVKLETFFWLPSGFKGSAMGMVL